MNWNIVQDSWKQLKSKVTAHWDKLDNINTVTPKGEEVTDENQEKNGVVRDEAEKQVERIKDTH